MIYSDALQRIGRVHRLGQSRPVYVIHMLTGESIEDRVWETLRLKKSLFAGVFDSPTGEISFAKLGRKTVLQAVKEIFAEQPGRPKPTIDHPLPAPVGLKEARAELHEQSPVSSSVGAQPGGALPAAEKSQAHNGIETAAASFLEAGLRFLESFTADGASGNAAGAPASRLDQALSSLFTRDERTKRPALTIPLPESVTRERLTGALSALLGAFGQADACEAEMEKGSRG